MTAASSPRGDQDGDELRVAWYAGSWAPSAGQRRFLAPLLSDGQRIRDLAQAPMTGCLQPRKQQQVAQRDADHAEQRETVTPSTSRSSRTAFIAPRRQTQAVWRRSSRCFQTISAAVPAQAASSGRLAPVASRKTSSADRMRPARPTGNGLHLVQDSTLKPHHERPERHGERSPRAEVLASALPPRKRRNGENAWPRIGARITGTSGQPSTLKT